MPADQRHAIEAAGQAILDARAERPEMSLEDHYSPTRMAEAVREAHTRLDRLVDQVFGITEPDPTFLRRQEVLFAHYEELSAHLLTASTPRTPRTAPAPRKATAAASDTARLGIYLTPEEFDDAKAGYLADWTNGGTCDTFGKWIAAAIDTYAARSPEQRAGAPARGRAEERTGSTRSFVIPSSTVARMREAISADHRAGRWPSDSAWCAEAIAAAVDQAREQNGGTLPTPPPRLPNRLVR